MALVLSPTEFRLLDGLRLAPRRTFHGRIRGERLTRRKGVSIEFADYRDYTEGDDLRHLDWNVLARLHTPVMKTYQDEEDLAVYLVVDATESMGFGEPSKLDLAKRLAAAFAYVALCGQDAVIPIAIPQRGVRPTRRGRSAFPQVSGWLDGIQSSGSPRSLAESLRELLAMYGYDVTLASCFSEAAAHRDEQYDVLITDIGLPDGDGVDLHRVLVHDDETRSIALSGYGSAQDVERSRSAGFDRHLTKPVRVDDLLRAIEDLTHRRTRTAAAGASA